MNYAFNISYAKSRIQAYRSLPMPNFNISQSFSIPKDFSVDVSYNYYSMNTGNIRVSDMQSLNLSFSKRFPKQNIHLILSYADVANLGSKAKISFGDTQTIYAKGKNSGINFTARYNFGQELGSKVKKDTNVSSRL